MIRRLYRGQHLSFVARNKYEYVERPQQVVAVIPVTKDGKVVLTKQWREPVQKYVFDIPAGLVDKGETPEEAAAREALEETGYTVYLGEVLRFATSPGLTNETVLVYWGEIKESTPGLASEKGIEVVEVPLEEVASFIQLQQLDENVLVDVKCGLALHYESWINNYVPIVTEDESVGDDGGYSADRFEIE